MALLPWISMLLLLKGSQSYILLTANLDDVHAIAQQIAHSPVAGQIHSILRRASNIFNQQLRARNDDGYQHRSSRSNPRASHSLEPIQDNGIERRSQVPHHSHHHHHRRSGKEQSQSKKQSQESEPMKDTLQYQPVSTVTHPNRHKVSSDHHSTSRVEFTPADNEVGEERLHHKGKAPRHEEDANSHEVEDRNPGQTKEEKPQTNGAPSKDESERDEQRRRDDNWKNTNEMVALGKNASFYLNSIKEIMENV